MSDARILAFLEAVKLIRAAAPSLASEDTALALGILLSAGMPQTRSLAVSAAVHAHLDALGAPHSSKPDASTQQKQAVTWTEQGLPFCDASIWEVIAVTGLTAVLNSPDDWDAVPSHMYQGCAWWLAVTAEACMGKHAEQQTGSGTAADGLTDCTLPALEAHLTLIGEQCLHQESLCLISNSIRRSTLDLVEHRCFWLYSAV